MKILHKLANSSKVIPLGTPDFATLHTQKGDRITHEGFVIEAPYAGESEREKKHTYGLLFNVDEARAFHAALTELLGRFDSEQLPDFTVVNLLDDLGNDD